MERAQPSHHDGGLHRVLNRAGVYGALQKMLLRSGSRERYVREFVRPFPGCRILDIGCGKGAFLRSFRDHHPEWHCVGIEPSREEA